MYLLPQKLYYNVQSKPCFNFGLIKLALMLFINKTLALICVKLLTSNYTK